MLKLLYKQWLFLKEIEKPYSIYCGGYGAGKTYAGCLKAIILSVINEGRRGMYVSPTYPMALDIVKATFDEMFDTWGFEYYFNEKKMKYILGNGSEILLRSADNPKRLKGTNLAWAGLDEAGQMDHKTWDIVISRVRDPKATLLQTFITTTYEGYNWLYNNFPNAPNSDITISDKYILYIVSTEENKFLPESYVDNLKNQYDELAQRQYIKGIPTDLTQGRVYYAFDRSKHTQACSLNPNYPIIVACDFNITPCVWLLMQNIDGIIYVYDELVMRSANTFLMCDALQEKVKNHYSGLVFYGDYTSVKARSTAASFSDWQIIEERFKNYYGYQKRLKPNPKVKERVNVVNNLFSKNKVVIDPTKCLGLIKDFEQVVWSVNKMEIDKLKDKDRTHYSDGFGYYVDYEFSYNKPRGYIN